MPALEDAIARIDAIADEIERAGMPGWPNGLRDATAAARAHLTDSHREPVAWKYTYGDEGQMLSSKHIPGMRDVPGWMETPLYALAEPQEERMVEGSKGQIE